jgi:hypothetical protein
VPMARSARWSHGIAAPLPRGRQFGLEASLGESARPLLVPAADVRLEGFMVYLPVVLVWF